MGGGGVAIEESREHETASGVDDCIGGLLLWTNPRDHSPVYGDTTLNDGPGPVLRHQEAVLDEERHSKFIRPSVFNE